MFSMRKLAFAAVILCVATARGQSTRREPHVGYLYPAGGRQGTTVYVIAGGQFLFGPTDIYVSGKGVSASVDRYIKPLFNIRKEQRFLLMKRMAEVREKRLKEAKVAPEAIKKISADRKSVV